MSDTIEELFVKRNLLINKMFSHLKLSEQEKEMLRYINLQIDEIEGSKYSICLHPIEELVKESENLVNKLRDFENYVESIRKQ